MSDGLFVQGDCVSVHSRQCTLLNHVKLFLLYARLPVKLCFGADLLAPLFPSVPHCFCQQFTGADKAACIVVN